MQAYFELLQIPQTSCDYYQSALTFNKRDLLSGIKTLRNKNGYLLLPQQRGTNRHKSHSCQGRHALLCKAQQIRF